MKKFVPIIVLLLSSFTLQASDHIDGPITSEDNVADLSDLYAFPTPSRPGYVTLILNSYPMVPPGGHFDHRLLYQFKLRQVQMNAQGVQSRSESEQTIKCQFQMMHNASESSVSCETTYGLSLKGKLNAEIRKGNTKLWAGMRSDPFFFNASWAKSVSTEGQIPEPNNSNIMDKMNTLSIVLELKYEEIFPETKDHRLFGVLAEIHVGNLNSQPHEQLDRVGRPEITNVSLAPKGEEDVRDLYNSEDSFAVQKLSLDKFKTKLKRNIVYYDSLDQQTDWKEQDLDRLVNLLMKDYLLIDMSKPCSKNSFLSIEKAYIKMQIPNDCGGRFLHADIMDELFGFYINGGKAPVRDGVSKPYRTIKKEFPYLNEPDTGMPARMKAWAARQAVRFGFL